MTQATTTKSNQSVKSKETLVPKAVKNVVLKAQEKLREEAQISNNLNRLLDANSDCV